MTRIILSLIIVGTITGCASPEQKKPPCNIRTLDPGELVMTPFSFSNSLITQN